VLQTMRKYGAPLASVAVPTHDTWSPELVGEVEDELINSCPSWPATQVGGVLSTVSVVVAVLVASAFSSSVLPMLRIKMKVKMSSPDNADNTVIFPAVSTYRGRLFLLYNILNTLLLYRKRVKVMH